MTCSLCDKIIEVENSDSLISFEDRIKPEYNVHSIAGFTVCLNCKNKVIQFFRDLVKT